MRARSSSKYRLDSARSRARARSPIRRTKRRSPATAVFAETTYPLVARPADAFRAAQGAGRSAGYDCLVLGDRLQGEAREVAAEHAAAGPRAAAQGRRVVILSGGELTVTLRGQGRGGPNQEYALALAIHLDGAPGIAALAADTDGTDGGRGRPDDPAGAFIDADHARARPGRRPRSRRLSRRQQFHGVFQGIGDLLRPGPTFTNVTDFRAIIVDRPVGLTWKLNRRVRQGDHLSRTGVSRRCCCAPCYAGSAAGRIGGPGGRPISASATTPAAASASRSATRTPTAGPPKAGGTCRTNLRDHAQGRSGRALLLHLCDRLRPRRRMVGPGLHVHARQGVHHPRHQRLPGARLRPHRLFRGRYRRAAVLDGAAHRIRRAAAAEAIAVRQSAAARIRRPAPAAATGHAGAGRRRPESKNR